jgi:hypothetical protein
MSTSTANVKKLTAPAPKREKRLGILEAVIPRRVRGPSSFQHSIMFTEFFPIIFMGAKISWDLKPVAKTSICEVL